MKAFSTTQRHRPWPAPPAPWLLAMRWHDLLFMHWPIRVAAIRQLIPARLSVDTFDGAAWLGVVPFRMSGVRPRLAPEIPWISAFPELNVRTYVVADGKPGVWFFSLDAGNPIAVEVARDVFHLPYYNARMACAPRDGGLRYSSIRRHRAAAPAAFQADYRPTGPVYRAQPGTLEHWLTERYYLYAANRGGRVWRGEIDHAPWPLQPAEADLRRNTMTDQIRIALPHTQPLLHFARRLDVVAWRPDLCEA